MADGVDASMNAVQLPRRDAGAHTTRAQATFAQLRKRDDTMLLQSERGHGEVDWGSVTLRPYVGRNVTGSRHAAIVEAPALRISGRLRRICP
jgi:hypothetical protein